MESTLPALAVQSMEILTVEQLKAAHARSQPVAFTDPMLASVALPLRRTLYPLGFPLEISTNHGEVLEIAGECWQGFVPLFDIAPMRMHIGVTRGGPPECPPAPFSRIREHICSHVADAENFSISDAAAAFTYAWLAESTLRYRSYVRYFHLESAAMFHLAARYTVGIHAACVAREGAGVLLSGDSGAGKSTLAYACSRAGWTYITDDASFLVNGREDSLVVGNNRQFRFRPSAGDLFPELRGRPAMQRVETGKPSLEWPLVSLSRLATGCSAAVRHLVFLNRRPDLEPGLVAFPPEVARAFILQRVIGIPAVAGAQREGIEILLGRGVYELRYSDLNWAVERLARLLEEGR